MCIESFKKAFMMQYAGFREECNCGEIFYERNSLAWDFEDSEERWLCENATLLDHGVRQIEIEGTSYVSDCDCWHPRAEKIMSFLNRNRTEVSAYLNTELARMKYETEQMKIIEILSTKEGDDEGDDDIPF